MNGARLLFATKAGLSTRAPLATGRLQAKKFLVPCLIAGILCTALISPQSEPASFCDLCGTRQEATAWMVRGTGASLLRTHAIAPTPISQLLVRKKLVAAHVHRWRAPEAVPNPLDQSGPPVMESLEFINAPRVVNFMRDLAEYGDAESVTQWRDVLLQPQYSYVIDDALRFLLVPPGGFSDRTTFLAWWGGNGFALHNRLRELTEPD
jgi:hypothetical protein